MKGFRWKWWMIPMLLAVGLTVAAKLGWFAFGQTGKAVEKKDTVHVTAGQAVYVKKSPGIQITGSLEAKTSAMISAKINGRIEQVLVDNGKEVAAGDTLVTLENVELNNGLTTSKNALRSELADYNNILVDYQRAQTLYSQNAISKQQLDAMETKVKVAEAKVSTAYAGLSSSEQQVGYSHVPAPVPGVIANKTATVGQVVAAGAPLMQVEDIRQVYAVANVEQKDIGNIRIGQMAQVTVDAYPNKVFQGRVEIINPVAGNSNRMFSTKILLDNGEGNLRPGMFVKLSVETGVPVDVLVVPQAAVFQKQGLYYVYVIVEGKAEKTQIEIGRAFEDVLEIKKGLTPNMTVVTSNVTKLKDGDLVTVVQ